MKAWRRNLRVEFIPLSEAESRKSFVRLWGLEVWRTGSWEVRKFVSLGVWKFGSQKFGSSGVLRFGSFEMWGSGKPKREIIFVDDIAEACLFFMKKKTKHSLINIGSGNDATIEDYANKIINYFNVKLKITKNRKMPDGVKRKLLSIKIAKSYGWRPKINLETGIKVVLENMNYWKHAPLWTKKSIKRSIKNWNKLLK